MQTPCSRPAKELFAEYLANLPLPTAFTWLNLYLEKIRSKIFSMDNLLHKFVTLEGQEGYGLNIASILDSIYKFGRRHDRDFIFMVIYGHIPQNGHKINSLYK
jgi:hypothetical protein